MEIKLPLLIINFKAYQQSIGKNAENLAKICEKVAKKAKLNIAVAVQDADLYRVVKASKIPVFAQHLEPIGFGSYTGHDIPEGIKESGAKGALINHSENRLQIDQIESAVKKAKDLGLISCVCANDAGVAKAVASFKPDLIAVEPPELIGGDISVSTARPEVITETIEKVKEVADIPVLCGAGVNSGKDVAKAVELGSKGILVASAVTKAEDPEKAIHELAKGFFIKN